MALTGKSAVVTGAAGGIGKGLSEVLLRNGAKVALLDVNESAGQSLMESLNQKHGTGSALFLKCDVESEEQLRAAFQKAVETFGGIDILCNNAGVMNETAWEKTVSINLMSVIRASYIALEHMSKLNGGRGGVIVQTASMAGLGPFPSCPVYTATKSGVVGFTRAMAVASEVSGYGIRFNALCPTFVQTEMITNISGKLGQFTHLTGMAVKLTEKLGILSVSEVAESLLELVTDETKNGEALMILTQGKAYMQFPSLSK
ncbi:15-hydroxyprostaglandin dehydrogenase [NAD(+)] [Oryzias melastigma]|uniref:15-hydroxyprostaglandin dehydrogenase [NAD(+)] n=1 Tax=Oryzias melastigma TaxID=30732 RepID=A0A3B3B9F1_ORYME|nr:15-hydroxyprostaglandin dehydrogenase [NAD(+)] [Oryzias melastigma]KAF6725166.1 15-hydroxyprostaglandin dehydrogenase [NAD(+)] [Oryzias melastigma]